MRPDTAFGADLIAGFPTETDDQFETTLAFVEHGRASPTCTSSPSAPAPARPPPGCPLVAPVVVRERARRLREAGERGLARHLAGPVKGASVSAVIEKPGVARAADFSEIAFDPATPGRAGVLGRISIVEASDGRRLQARIFASA